MKISIIRECSDFLKESNGQALIKFLPKKGQDSRKVKVRKRRKTENSSFDSSFNNVFITHKDLRQRSIFASGQSSQNAQGFDDVLSEPFYIFPINGYKFIYSPDVFNSAVQYKEVLERFDRVLGKAEAIDVFSEVLKYDYLSTKLAEGIALGCEIIIYGIPHYYAIRKSTLTNYSSLFSL